MVEGPWVKTNEVGRSQFLVSAHASEKVVALASCDGLARCDSCN